MQSLNVHYRSLYTDPEYGDTYLRISSEGGSPPYASSYEYMESENGWGEHPCLHIKVDGCPYIMGKTSGRSLEECHVHYGYKNYSKHECISGIDVYTQKLYTNKYGTLKDYVQESEDVFKLVGDVWHHYSYSVSDGVYILRTDTILTYAKLMVWFCGTGSVPVQYLNLASYDWKKICSKIGPSIPPGMQYSTFLDGMSGVYLDTNNIANILQIVDIVHDILSFDIDDMLKDLASKLNLSVSALSSAWLAYRYQYLTTKSDVEEITTNVGNLVKPDTGWRIGRACSSSDGGTLRVRIPYRNSDAARFTSVWTDLKKWGVAPDLYNLWDMIPLSFVVDWFLPIGDYAEAFSKSWLTDTTNYTFGGQTWSWSWKCEYVMGDATVNVSYYHRWIEVNPPACEVYDTDPSTNTVVKRIIDGTCMIVG